MDRAEPAAGCARLPRMHTLRRLAALLILLLVVVACSGTAGPAASTSGAPPASAFPTPSVEPPVSDDPDGAVGTDVPPASDDLGNPPPIVAKPGQLDVHPVKMDGLQATVDGRRVVVTATWTSGVEPCYVLDHVVVDRGAGSFTITLLEGRGPGDNICIEIAQIKHTQVDLGDLQPGTYTIADGAGGAAPIEVTVS